MSHGFVTFRGVRSHREVQFTFTHGIDPSRCRIEIPPTPDIGQGGTLSLFFGPVRIDFPDCKADLIDVYRNEDGLEVWTLTVLDRRWKWKECRGQVSGYYNVRDGDKIRKGTEKNIRELMRLCLEALGETRFDVSTVPTNIFPEVEWDYEAPAEALARLADIVRFRILLRLNNTVAVVREGAGRLLPRTPTMEYTVTIDPPERPDSLRFVGQRKLWEVDLRLEPVARAPDFRYVNINDPAIPWKPRQPPAPYRAYDRRLNNYWWYYDPGFANAIFDAEVRAEDAENLRELAQADIYRKYRVLPGFKPKGAENRVDEIEQILPLLRERLTTEVRENKTVQLPFMVWGLFSRGECAPSLDDARLPVVDRDGNPPPESIYEQGVQLDVDTGILTFDSPMFKYGRKPEGFLIDGSRIEIPIFEPAEIFLRVGFGIRDPETRAWEYREVDRRLATGRFRFNTRPLYVKRDDVPLHYIYTGRERERAQERIEREYDKQAKYYLDEQQRSYRTRTPTASTYPGLVRFELDGAIQQVTWSITSLGATTRVSRDREEPILGLSWQEQRMYQQLTDRLRREETAKAAAERESKRP